MQHRELYRELVPYDAYIITYSDLARCKTPTAAEKIAKSIYYPLGGSYSNEVMSIGVKAHAIKEAEVGDWVNELKLAYKMSKGYYLCGTIDRYYTDAKILEDFKHTGLPAYHYLNTSQVETYAFLAINNDMTVNKGRYTTIASNGDVLTQSPVDINESTITMCYNTFISPRFNMIKDEIEKLRKKFTSEEEYEQRSES